MLRSYQCQMEKYLNFLSILNAFVICVSWGSYVFASLFVIIFSNVFDAMLPTLCVCEIVERRNRWITLACHTTIGNSCDAY